MPEDADVGADGEVTHPHVEVLLRLLGAGDLGARGHAALQRHGEHAVARRHHLRMVPLADMTGVHGVVGTAPLHHVEAGNRQYLLQFVDRALLLDHHGDDGIADRLDVSRTAARSHRRVAARRGAVQAIVLRGVGAGDANALAHVGGRAAIGEQHRLKPGADAALGEKRLMALVDLDHRAEPVQLRRAAHVVQVVQMKRAVLGHELDVVELAGLAEHLHAHWIGVEDARAHRDFIGRQLPAQGIGSHQVVSLIVGRGSAV